MSARERGEVVWHPAVFVDYDRPYLVVSTDTHPFHGEEYIALSISTNGIGNVIPIETEDWAVGDLPKESYVKPWLPAILKKADITATAGALERKIVDCSVDRLAETCGR